MSGQFTGRCLCGAIHYTASGTPRVAGHCYCDDCRRSSGTSHGSHIAMAEEEVRIEGNPVRFDKAADSGNIVSRYFCGTCGGPIYSTNSAMPGLTFLRASSLDDLEVFKANLVVYASRAPSWSADDEGLQRFETMPPAEAMPS